MITCISLLRIFNKIEVSRTIFYVTMENIINKANKDIKNIEIYLNFDIYLNKDHNKNAEIYLNTFKESFEELYTNYKKVIYSQNVYFTPRNQYKHKIKPIYVYKKYEPNGTIIIYKNYNDQRKIYNEDGELEYEGQFKNDLRHGQGKSYYKNKYLDYDGQWKNDLRHGQGKDYYNGQLIYDG